MSEPDSKASTNPSNYADFAEFLASQGISAAKILTTGTPPTTDDFPKDGLGGLHLNSKTNQLSFIMNINGRLKALTFADI